MSALAVFDCMLFLQAVANEKGPAFVCFRLVEEGKVRLFVSPGILAEVRDVLTRPALQRKFPNLTPPRVEAFLQAVEARSTSVRAVPKVFTYARDPHDEPYINLAISIGAAYLVSRDKDLLDLNADPDFGKQFPKLRVLDPVAFLREVTNQPEDGPGDAGSTPGAT